MSKSIYIAGPMAGHPDYWETFALAERALIKKGWIVLNPAVLPQGLKPEAYMPICLAMLNAADAICMLEGWLTSTGARTEKAFAGYQRKACYLDLENVPDIGGGT